MHFLFCGSTNLGVFRVSLALGYQVGMKCTLNFFNAQRGYKHSEFIKLRLRFHVRKIKDSLVVGCSDEEFEFEYTTKRIKLVIIGRVVTWSMNLPLGVG